MGKIFCTNCGAELDETAVFCTNCGNKIDSGYSKVVEKAYEQGGNSIVKFQDKLSKTNDSVKGSLEKSGSRIDAYRSHLPKGLVKNSEDLIKTDLEFPDEIIAEKPLFDIDGNMGKRLLVYQDRCTISTIKGLKTAMRGIKGLTAGDKEFYYQDVSSVQFKNLGATTGYLMFEFAGSHSDSRMTDDNSFIFSATIGTKKYKFLKEKMPMVHKFLQERIREAKQTPAPQVMESQTSDADELLKFKQSY